MYVVASSNRRAGWDRRVACNVFTGFMRLRVLLRQSPLSFWPLHLGGWALFAVAMAAGRLGEWSGLAILVQEPVFASIAALVTAALHGLYVRLDLHAARPVHVFLVSVPASYLGGLVISLSYHWYLLALAPDILSTLSGNPPSLLHTEALLDGAVYHTVIVLGWTALYFGMQHSAELSRERERALRAEGQAHQARLQALRYQLNPHFLFNALNGVSTLVSEGRVQEATRMIARLSDFLRLTLETGDDIEVALVDEADLARRYLEIEHVRFGDRLDLQVNIAPDVFDSAVPALVLQPLVENAVKHALSASEGTTRISLEAHREGDNIVLLVNDTGPGMDLDAKATEARSGVGLANVRARLRELYGESGHLDITTTLGEGFSASVTFPHRSVATI